MAVSDRNIKNIVCRFEEAHVRAIPDSPVVPVTRFRQITRDR